MIGIERSIEVDEDRQSYTQRAQDAQEDFIVEFIGSLYTDMEAEHEQLSKVVSLHFNRIFKAGWEIGANVRLRIFAEETDMDGIDQEIESRLEVTKAKGKTFQVLKRPNNWNSLGQEYGGPQLRFVFLDHLDAVSRSAYRLLCYKQQGVDPQLVENALWSWTHMFFNSVRGHGVSVLEFPQGLQPQVNFPPGTPCVFHSNV